MGLPLADFEDVARRVRGGVPDGDRVFVAALIEDASAVVRARFPDIDSRMLVSNPPADAVVGVVASVVKRAYQSPGDGVSQEVAGPFAASYSNPAGDLFLREAEVALLGGVAVRGARSVRMGY